MTVENCKNFENAISMHNAQCTMHNCC